MALSRDAFEPTPMRLLLHHSAVRIEPRQRGAHCWESEIDTGCSLKRVVGVVGGPAEQVDFWDQLAAESEEEEGREQRGGGAGVMVSVGTHWVATLEADALGGGHEGSTTAGGGGDREGGDAAGLRRRTWPAGMCGLPPDTASVAEADWADFYGIEDPTRAWDWIENHIMLYLDGVCPKVIRTIKDRGNSWMTADILSLIHEREENVSLFYTTGDEIYLDAAKALRCRINKSVRYAKCAQVKEALENTKSNPKAFWRNVNSLMKPEGPVEPPVLIGNDNRMKTKQDSVEYLNEYFANIGEVLSSDLTAKGHVRCIPDATFDRDSNRSDPIKVEPELVQCYFDDINVNKTSGIEHLRGM